MIKNVNVSILFTRFYMVIVLIFLLWSGGTVANGQTSKSHVQLTSLSPGAVVAPICSGQQIEEFNHQLQGGLYAQMINNPSFEGVEKSHSELALNENRKFSGRIFSTN